MSKDSNKKRKDVLDNDIIEPVGPEFISGMHMPNNETQYRPNYPDTSELGYEDDTPDDCENNYLGPLDAFSPYEFRTGGIEDDEQHNRLFGGGSEVSLPSINKLNELLSLYDELVKLGIDGAANRVLSLYKHSAADTGDAGAASTPTITLVEDISQEGVPDPTIISEEESALDRWRRNNPPLPEGEDTGHGPSRAEPADSSSDGNDLVVNKDGDVITSALGCSGGFKKDSGSYYPIIFAKKMKYVVEVPREVNPESEGTDDSPDLEPITEERTAYKVHATVCYGKERETALNSDFSLHMAAGHGMTGAYFTPGTDQFWLHWNNSEKKFYVQRITYWYARGSDWGRLLRDVATPWTLEQTDEDPMIEVARSREGQRTSGKVSELYLFPLAQVGQRDAHTSDLNTSEGTDMGDFLHIIWDVYEEVESGKITEEQALLKQLIEVYTTGSNSKYTLNHTANYVDSSVVNNFFAEYLNLKKALSSFGPGWVILDPETLRPDVAATNICLQYLAKTRFTDIDNFYRKLIGEI